MKAADAAAFWEGNAETWTRHARAGYDIYRDALNTPAFLAMLPAIGGLEGIDIGCGEGSNTRRLAERGARMCAIDVAPTFIRHARASEIAQPLGIAYHVADAHALPFADGVFDFATAFMSLMDVPDPAVALREAYRVLRPGGFLQFSIIHPCFDPAYRKVLRDDDGAVRAIEIAGYFDDTDGVVDRWWFATVPCDERARVPPFQTPRFHRKLSDWVAMLRAAGFAIEAFGEPRASAELAELEPVVADTRVAPLFLHIRVEKPAQFCRSEGG